jgi:SAM-dependent methyltransferase
MNNDELDQWFADLKTLLETAYLKGTKPWQQSGFGLHRDHTYERWRALRQPIADAIDASGSLLDIGCANGYLLECVLGWTEDRGLSIVPFGIDLSQPLIDLARVRLPLYADNFVCANGWDWEPDRTFDYVRTELVYVPDELRQRYASRILDRYLSPGGRLLAAEYRSRADEAPVLTIDQELAGMGFVVEDIHLGIWEGVEQTRIAVLRKPMS